MKIDEINRPSPWNGKPLKGEWLMTLKLDGVRAIWHDELGWMSRADKPLYNIPPWTGGPRDCEIYVGNFRDTIRATRTKHLRPATPVVRRDHLYGLDPLDARLRWGTLTNPTADDIQSQLQRANSLGYEGLVLRQRDHWIKIKPEETHDVIIIGYVEGRGKHLGRLGYVKTAMGDVGSGFTDNEREVLWAEAKADRLIGQVIEVSSMETTTNAKFRHPSFVRTRPDKLAPGRSPASGHALN
ncbi:ATP-dependent DNA ligase [Bradyrhizobium sp. AUGA SZCCT0274]|uniref:ATP-dependent DNA ligase n=1 Tax=Bradyrhizobium sp. AUGA SZCCT0274 TaxID=2807670 RepID=UPI001BAAE1AD|nr:ATP-dependent DNA ligase [Bradyrhizobium sp. AUGA SZCCT0274]MBR1240267.1 ATP-dependent DNA ligase [Bradyrhizobium sp. AUGA SZCCT0274]